MQVSWTTAWRSVNCRVPHLPAGCGGQGAGGFKEGHGGPVRGTTSFASGKGRSIGIQAGLDIGFTKRFMAPQSCLLIVLDLIFV